VINYNKYFIDIHLAFICLSLYFDMVNKQEWWKDYISQEKVWAIENYLEARGLRGIDVLEAERRKINFLKRLDRVYLQQEQRQNGTGINVGILAQAISAIIDELTNRDD